MNGRAHLSDEAWFERYGAAVGAAAVSVADPERVRQFAALVALLEARTGKPLGEPGRARCFTAFCENERGFRRLVTEAGERGTRNAVGLLIRMVEAGEHIAPTASNDGTSERPVIA